MKALSLDEYVERAKNKHNHKYSYENTIYLNAKTKITINCPKHGEFLQNPDSHLRGCGCPKCQGKNLSTQEYVAAVSIVHQHQYDYSLVNYTGIKEKIKIICPIHGEFAQRAEDHRNGNGCPKCIRKNLTIDDFINEAKIIHKQYNYDYSLAEHEYINLSTTLSIVCPIHGIFQIMAGNLLRGNKCSSCAIEQSAIKRSKPIDQFINEANKSHGNRYDYSLVEYKHSYHKIKIGCPSHGVFEQTPVSHINGRGCPSCNKRISIGETQWLDWLSVVDRQFPIRINGRRRFLDGYDPVTNTAFLYHGDFWHGNPNKFDQNKINTKTNTTYGDLYRDTVEFEKELKELGFNVVTMWESSWKEYFRKGGQYSARRGFWPNP
ncbi:hypothetical protein UFOVP29_236 [uncultured Caudovirales phage]|uniref:Uncharacterized protein n=1 Tax=uncultured Caudovirales phage TaxID=2100421 RepID=A0A6J5KQI3_9CAUD|nr:hypothetical protein UFOVP29_236 [uncultured Caudovirales phage]